MRHGSIPSDHIFEAGLDFLGLNAWQYQTYNTFTGCTTDYRFDDAYAKGMTITDVLDISANPFKPKIYSQSAEPNIPNDTCAFWKDTDDGKYYLILDIGGTQKKVELT